MDTLDILTDFIDEALMAVGALFMLVKIMQAVREVIARIFYSRDFDTLSAAILNATIRLPN